MRGLKLRCPACGECRLFQSLFKMREQCSFCEMVFNREQGYFVGAIYINVIATESLIFFAYLISLLALPAADAAVYAILFALALTLPILFHHHARSLWLSFDYFIDPPEKPPLSSLDLLD